MAVYEEWSASDVAFDEVASRSALATIDLHECMREESSLYGSGRLARVQVSPRGAVIGVVVEPTWFDVFPSAPCIVRLVGAARVPAFGGGVRTIVIPILIPGSNMLRPER